MMAMGMPETQFQFIFFARKKNTYAYRHSIYYKNVKLQVKELKVFFWRGSSKRNLGAYYMSYED